jgi:hypothetical protein
MTRITSHIPCNPYQIPTTKPSTCPALVLLAFTFSLYTLFFILYTPVVSAQDSLTPTPVSSDFDAAKTDYLHAYDQYRLDHISYVAARSAYLQYQTEITKAQAIQATQRMLNSRQTVIIKYLTTLKSRLQASPGLTQEELDTSTIDLNTKIDWLNQRAQLFNDAETLDDLVKLSKEIEKDYQEIELISYQVLGKILLAKDRVLRQSVTDLHQLVNDQVIRAREEGFIKTTVMERWLLDAQDRIELSQLKESQALAQLADIKERDKTPTKVKKFTEYQIQIDQVNQYLKEATQLMLETIQQMKHAS